MSLRFSVMMIGSLVLVVIGTAFTPDHFCSAQSPVNGILDTVEETEQPVEVQKQPLMTPAPDQASVKFAVEKLHLNRYQAAVAGDLSLCGDDTTCSKHVKDIESWFCVAGVCNGTDTSKTPLDCFEGISDSDFKETRDQLNSSFCSLIKSPSAATRKAFLANYPDGTEDGVVESQAYLFARMGSAAACEAYIKNYVGPYGGPQWTQRWYAALSGCRILARASTREQEESDFYRWFGVIREAGDPCLEIVNSELRNACSALTAKPISPDDQ